MTRTHTPLIRLSEDDLIWIGRFAGALRELAPERYAVPMRGVAADDEARQALIDPSLRVMTPHAAAAGWLASRVP